MPHARRIALGVQRVALEVEEQVAVVGTRQRAECLRRDDLVRGHGRLIAARGDRLAGARGRAELQARLRLQHRERIGVHALRHRACGGELVDRLDAGRAQPLALQRAHAGDQQQIARGHDLEIARGAATARDHAELAARVAPGDRGSVRSEVEAAVGDESAQARAAQREDRKQVIRDVLARRAVAQEQLDPVGARDAEPIELVDVRRQLHERGHAGAARELAVLHDPAPGLIPHQEVCEAHELVRGERRLVDDIRVGGQRGVRVVDRGGQGRGIRRRASAISTTPSPNVAR